MGVPPRTTDRPEGEGSGHTRFAPRALSYLQVSSLWVTVPNAIWGVGNVECVMWSVRYEELKMSLRAEESAKQSLTRALSSENDIHNGIVVSSGCVFAIATLEKY